MKNQHAEMIPFEEAYKTVMAFAARTGTESVLYTASLNRILAGDVVSDMDMPPFNKSSVDGFACRKSDLVNDLEIVGTIAAGTWPSLTLTQGQCSRIMTGAAVPEGADCVIMVEDTELLSSGKIRFTGTGTKENISKKAEDLKKGDIVLRSGKLIKPQDIAVMAAVGYTTVKVAVKPAIAVISSGNELVEPDELPGISQIRNSNAWQLMAQIEQCNASSGYYGIARDDEAETYSIINRAVSENDIVIITGGVSMGDFDFVPSVLEKTGVKILFSRVAVQPGKPTTFGIHPHAAVFGLPGNPVSSFIQFEMLVKPFIFKMAGHNWSPKCYQIPMKETYSRRSTERMAFVPVNITDDYKALPVEYHGSAHISALNYADGIISVAVGRKTVEKGEIVSVRPI